MRLNGSSAASDMDYHARVDRVDDDLIPTGRERPASPSNDDNMDHLKAKIRHVPDFPRAGILFTTSPRSWDPAGFS